MAYVIPNSTVQLFKGIALDNRYIDTIYFANTNAQDSWFSSRVFKTFNNQMYHRIDDNNIKVEADATELQGVTYMRFRNSRTGSKWFYAFVNVCDYVNENTARINFEIDVMQTWFMQGGSVKPCMILREHTNNDSYYSNLQDEPISSDNYVYDFIKNANSITLEDDAFEKYDVVVNTTGKPISGYDYWGGLYIGTKFKNTECSSSEQSTNVTQMLEDLLGDWDEGEQREDVIDLFTAPHWCAYTSQSDYKTLYLPEKPTFTDYVPKNNKLYNYPFTYLYGTTHNGEANIYKWELFKHGANQYTQEFYVRGQVLGGCQIICYPHDYAGIDENFNAGMVMANFPKNAFAFDAYQAWVAAGGKTRLQNDEMFVTARGATNITAASSNLANTAIQSGIDIANSVNATSPLTGNPVSRSTANKVSSISSGINNMIQASASLANTIIDYKEAKYKISYQWKDSHYRPNEIVGSSVPNVMVGSRKLNFYFYNVHPVVSEMIKLDDFLSCYGYATNQVKSPNLTGRRFWNFVQTQGAIIGGDMPATSKEAIGRIFDGGITFWHNGDQIGNYAQATSSGSIDNPIA